MTDHDQTTALLLEDLIPAIRDEMEGEIGARDSYDPTTPGFEYHDGWVDALQWVLEYINAQ
jgi:hypothetical protein